MRTRRVTILGSCLFLACGLGTGRSGDDERGERGRALSALSADVVSADFPAVLPCGGGGTAKVVMRNSGLETWTGEAGFKLGAVGDSDDFYTRDTRVYLDDGVEVPPGGEAVFHIELVAPDSPGARDTDWQMVLEHVQWFGAVAKRRIDVQCGGGGGGGGGGLPPPSGGEVELCDGVVADTSGQRPAAAAIQACVERTEEGGELELPAGTYRIDRQLWINQPITLRTAGTAGQGGSCLNGVRCAVLQAAPDLYVENGFVAIAGQGVRFEHIVLDGNRQARLSSRAAAVCNGGHNRVGFNATAQECTSCAFYLSASINALCGTGFEWIGDGAEIIGSSFKDNGDNARHMMWADGLTLIRSDGSVVRNNEFVDNSDIGFICGGARGGVFIDNVIHQQRQLAFGGLMLDNFNGNSHGDFEGAVVRGNQIQCTSQQCDYGIVIGPHAWYPSANTRGGTVTGNVVRNAKMGIVVSGGGTPDAPVGLFGNDVAGSPSSARFTCGQRQSGNIVIAPDSHVDTRGDPTPFQRFAVDACP
ncbi:MAG: right-handed parallel beta-helix repeat-containing protein [Myxococcota bacterium]